MKRMRGTFRKNENSLRELQDNIKHTNVCMIGIPEENKRSMK